MEILIDEAKLGSRKNRLRTNLLFLNKKIFVGRTMSNSNNTTNLFIKDNSYQGNNPENLFKTKNENIIARYNEIWGKISSNIWRLEGIKFRIDYKKTHSEHLEIASFHIENSTETYKKYPHIHVKHPKIEAVSNAHIALNLNDYISVTKSIEALDDNIKNILTMINEEFILKFVP